jgi:signal transduction histidine kinase
VNIRQQLARDLHDEMGSLAVVKIGLDRAAASVSKGHTREARRTIEDTAAVVAAAIEGFRRILLDLAPAPLEAVGLPEAIRAATRQFASRTGIRMRLREKDLPARLPRRHETALYRVLQGALSNVLRHSQAESAAVTVAATRAPAVVLTVEDDGVGFSAREASSRGRFGLSAMRARAEALGGRLRVGAGLAHGTLARPGTRIEVTLPLPPGDAM